MGESSIREGRQVEKVFEAEIMADQLYIVRSVQSTDTASLSTIGFGTYDNLDGIEIAGITATPPEGYATTSTGDFPVLIVYGMAGIAAIAGIVFFFISSRSLKGTNSEQTGIDPNRLQGYETSDSSGGYKTNRGEAQLKDDTDYQQTRSHYDEPSQQSPPPQTDLLLRMMQHVDVQHLLKWVQNVIVQCKVHVYVMEHVDVVQIFVKTKLTL